MGQALHELASTYVSQQCTVATHVLHTCALTAANSRRAGVPAGKWRVPRYWTSHFIPGGLAALNFKVPATATAPQLPAGDVRSAALVAAFLLEAKKAFAAQPKEPTTFFCREVHGRHQPAESFLQIVPLLDSCYDAICAANEGAEGCTAALGSGL